MPMACQPGYRVAAEALTSGEARLPKDNARDHVQVANKTRPSRVTDAELQTSVHAQSKPP